MTGLKAERSHEPENPGGEPENPSGEPENPGGEVPRGEGSLPVLSQPRAPERSERFFCRFVAPPHPATIEVDRLLAECHFRAQRRSGPGGQHRNKTSSGVFLEHLPTGIVGEATERRSQPQNRAVALARLRLQLAVAVRTEAEMDVGAQQHPPREEAEVRDRYRARRLRLADDNVEKPAVIALLLNDLHAAGGQPSLVARQWQVTTTSIVSLLQSYRPALDLVNAIRNHHGRPALKSKR